VTRAELAAILRNARAAGWQHKSTFRNGGFREWAWFSAEHGVTVTVLEQSWDLFYLKLGATTAAMFNTPTGGLGLVSLPQILGVLEALDFDIA
jgi:hypothetical protein